MSRFTGDVNVVGQVGYDALNNALKTREDAFALTLCNGGCQRQVIFVDPTTAGGSFKLTYNGTETGSIDWNSDTSNAAGKTHFCLLAINKIGANGCTISGQQFPGRQVIAFQNNGTVIPPYPLMTCSTNALTVSGGGAAPAPLIGYAISDVAALLGSISITTVAAGTLQVYNSSYPDPLAKMSLITLAGTEPPHTLDLNWAMSGGICIVPSTAAIKFTVNSRPL